MLINNIQTENGVSNIMSNLCKQYVENELIVIRKNYMILLMKFIQQRLS